MVFDVQSKLSKLSLRFPLFLSDVEDSEAAKFEIILAKKSSGRDNS